MKIVAHKLIATDPSELIAFRQSLNYGGVLAPKGIILHSTDGDLAGTGSINWLCDKASKVSAHVVIDRDGKITQLVPFNRVAWHAGKSQWKGMSGLNQFAIGIEFANPGKLVKSGNGWVNGLGVKVDPSIGAAVVYHDADAGHPAGYYLPMTSPQMEAALSLSRLLVKTYGVSFVATHWQISPGRKSDPNPTVDVELFSQKIFGEQEEEEEGGVAIVSELNVRAQASSSATVIDVLNKRSLVTIRGSEMNGSTKWLLVDFLSPKNGTPNSGWVAARYIELC